MFAIARKLVDDIVYEVEGQLIVLKEGDVDIGGNPSAEEQEEALENGATQVNNVVHSHRLQQTSFDKKSYLTYLKVHNDPPSCGGETLALSSISSIVITITNFSLSVRGT